MAGYYTMCEYQEVWGLWGIISEAADHWWFPNIVHVLLSAQLGSSTLKGDLQSSFTALSFLVPCPVNP